jgi:Spy/CpxP family protein refolding chaperone
MKGRILIVPAAVLATATAVAIVAAQASDRSPTVDPGFVPNTGQINPGHAAEPWSDAPPQAPQPSQEEARAALMMPDNGAPSAGPGSTPAPNGAEQLTTGSTSASTTAAAPASSPGPIGATTQTMPAKFSQRNDVLDRVPTTAWPLPLNEEQRRQIFNSVMADGSPPAAGAAALKPGSSLSFEQTLDLHPLPGAVADMDGLHGLQYVKGKDKVLLVRPPNGIVVDEITL